MGYKYLQMAKKNKKKKKIDLSGEGGFVFSTNSEFIDEVQSGHEDDTEGDVSGLEVRVWLEKKGRGGKTATIIRGLEDHGAQAFRYASELKSHCSCGGSLKEGEIILQGDVRDKAIAYLKKEGIRALKAGG